MPPQGGGGGSKTPLIILLVVVLVGAVGAGAFFLLSGDDASPETVVEDYIAAAEDGDCEQANQYLVPDLQGSSPCTSEPDPIENVNLSSSEDGDSAVVDVSFTSQALGDMQIRINLTRVDGDWLISDFDAGELTIPEPDDPPTIPEPDDPPVASPDVTLPPIEDDSSTGSVGAGTPPPPFEGGDSCFDSALATCEGMASACQNGDMAACDDLWPETRSGSAYEEYAGTCGGRREYGVGGCEAELG